MNAPRPPLWPLAVLSIENLEVVYHSVVLVLKGVSLEVPEGSVVALLGPNGAGKTTALRAITGLLGIHRGEITHGRITWRGRDITGLAPDRIVRQGISQVMEGRRILADLTVEENLRAGAYGRSRTHVAAGLARFYEAFPALARLRRQKAGYLSGGEQQMLAIARALIAEPALLVLDEPSLGLAPRAVAEVARLVRDIHARGVSILLVEQNAAMALELAERGYILENGKIVLDGPAATLAGDRDVQEFYLGIGQSGEKRYTEVKLYRRRRRWLS